MSASSMIQSDFHPEPGHFKAREQLLPLPSRALIMGILNVTPDSFWDGGRYLDPEAAVDHVLTMVGEGADLIDIGAESSRPGSDSISPEEEIRRLMPVIKAISKKVQVPISVDTTKAQVAQHALDAGASIVNDISALRFDPLMGSVIASYGAGVVLMHMKGVPKSMQQAPEYQDVVTEVGKFLSDRARVAQEAGIHSNQILLDPGIGFGKTWRHNLLLLSRLEALSNLGFPLVVGVSRKAFIGQVLNKSVDQRVFGTAAAVAVAIQKGARVIRVHDVGAMRDVVQMIEAVEQAIRAPQSGLR